jgi:hypothetical protein
VRPSSLAVLRLITSANFVRLHHRQIGRLGTREDLAVVKAGLAIQFGEDGEARSAAEAPIAHQTNALRHPWRA